MRGRIRDFNGVNYACPHCATQETYGPYNLSLIRYKACGLSPSEHKQVVRAWRRAQAQAEKQVHDIEFQSRMDTLYPKAVIKATYDEAHRRVGG
jgi:hypothetical protein